MKTHFFRFDGEAAAKLALADFTIADENGVACWDMSRVIPDQRVVISREPYQALPGYFVTVTLPDVDVRLRQLRGKACRLIGDPETGELVWTAPDVREDFLESAIIEPIPAGAAYYKVA